MVETATYGQFALLFGGEMEIEDARLIRRHQKRICFAVLNLLRERRRIAL